MIRGLKFDGLDQDETRSSQKQANTEVEVKRRWQSCCAGDWPESNTEPASLAARAASVENVEQMTFFANAYFLRMRDFLPKKKLCQIMGENV